MPFPLIPIALGLSAAGAAMGYAGQRRAAKAQNQVMQDYRARNKAREAEADALFRESLGQSGVDDAEMALDEGAARREAAYEAAARSVPSQPLPTTAKGNKEVKPNTVKNAGTVWEKLMNKAQSRLGSYSDWQLQQGIKDNRANQSIARVTDAARGDWNNVVPVEMTAASHKGDALQGWGQLLSAAGMLGGMSGALATAPAAAAPGGAASWGMSTFGPGTANPSGMWASLLSGLPK
jgi:hypothetical protein